MQLQTSSWHSRLYTFTYSKMLPQSLCPYFWKLVLAMVLFIPLTILYLPLIILRLVFEFNYFRYPTYFKGKDLRFMWLSNAICWDLIWIIRGFIHKEWKVLLFLFVAILIVTFVVIVTANLFEPKPKKIKPKKEKEPGILTEFIKAKYNRYCPKIYWQNN